MTRITPERAAEIAAKPTGHLLWSDVRDLLADLQDARTRIAELEAGLEPFADVADLYGVTVPGHRTPVQVVTVGDLRRARDLLRRKP